MEKCTKCKYGRGCPGIYDLLIPLSSGGFVIFQPLMITNPTERKLRRLDYWPVSSFKAFLASTSPSSAALRYHLTASSLLWGTPSP